MSSTSNKFVERFKFLKREDKMVAKHEFKQIDEHLFEVPATFRADMKVPAPTPQLESGKAMLVSILIARFEKLVQGFA